MCPEVSGLERGVAVGRVGMTERLCRSGIEWGVADERVGVNMERGVADEGWV